MKALVTLRTGEPGATTADIQITVDGTATVGDVAAALAGSEEMHGRWTSDRPATLRILNAPGGAVTVPPERSVLESGIRSGSTIELAPAEDARLDDSRPAVIVRVLSGRDTGLERPLPRGSWTIGRSSSCAVVLHDPLVSKTHARLVVGDRVELVDTGSANGILAGNVRVQRLTMGVGEVAELGGTRLTVTQAPGSQQHETASSEVEFLRSPRVVARPTDDPVDLPDPPDSPQASRFPYLSLVAPLILGVVLFATTGRLITLAFIVMSPLLILGSFIDQRIQNRKSYRERVEEFDAELTRADERLATRQHSELMELEALHPGLDECLDATIGLTDLLWSRRPEHPEFLQVRIGTGAVAPRCRPVLPRQLGLPQFAERLTALHDARAELPNAAVVANLRSVGGVGVVGRVPMADGVARGLVAQVASLHSPAEVVIGCLTSGPGRARWDWLKWLPHCTSPHAPLPLLLAADPGSGKVLLEVVEELIAVRRGRGSPSHRGPVTGDDQPDEPVVPSVLLVIDEPNVDQARLNRVAEAGPDVGIFVLWVSDTRGQLPAACRTFVDIGERGVARVGLVRDGRLLDPVSVELLGAGDATQWARRAAPLVDSGVPVQDSSDLPRNVSVVSLLGADESDSPATIVDRWRENGSLVAQPAQEGSPRAGVTGLDAVVGHAGSEPFVLDLRTQGPHALVGGTTGAGKSEFLQAWVLGLAHAYSPDRVTFLFVDYKGGAAFASCIDLPHVVGIVTDLTPYLVRRVLRSLRAELHFRERLLNDKGAKDLLELEETGDPDCPPSLLIIIDEFAALAGEVPEFVDGVVDIAQRGRSLGLHLIMATQRPAGVIKDNLRANTNLRIALRMADDTDSQDVLGDPMAAHFPPAIPGRAAAKTGPGRIRTFQSAFPGARTPRTASAPSIDVASLEFGPGRPWKLPPPPVAGEAVPQDIERLVTAISGAAVLGRVRTPRRPWLDELAAVYNLSGFGGDGDTRIPLGTLDNPDLQTQEPEYFEPDAEGNLVVIGAGGTGKTTALRSLAVASALASGGGQVHVYGLDFAGGQLGMLEQLPHVGSVVPGDDEDRVRRLLLMLTQLADERAERYSTVNASSLTEYREHAAAPSEPRLLLLVDGFSAFREAFDSSPAGYAVYQQFQRLLTVGRAVGLHVALTADRPSAVPNAVLSAFRRRVVLRQADEDAYLALGVPKDILTPASPPGRAVQVGRPFELQLAVLLGDEQAERGDTSAAAQAQALSELARSTTPRHQRPPAVGSLPVQVSATGLPPSVGGQPVLGISDDTLEPTPFQARGLVLISGPAQSGRTNALHWMAESVRRAHPELSLVHLSARRSPLTSLPFWTISADTEDEVRACLPPLEELVGQPAGPSMPLLAIFVEFCPEFIDTPLESRITSLLTQCKRNGHLVVAEGEGVAWGSPWPLNMEMRNARTGLLLQPDQSDGDTLLRTSLPRCKRTDFPPGRGFWVRAGRATKVQLPLVEEWVGGPMDEPAVVTETSVDEGLDQLPASVTGITEGETQR